MCENRNAAESLAFLFINKKSEPLHLVSKRLTARRRNVDVIAIAPQTETGIILIQFIKALHLPLSEIQFRHSVVDQCITIAAICSQPHSTRQRACKHCIKGCTLQPLTYSLCFCRKTVSQSNIRCAIAKSFGNVNRSVTNQIYLHKMRLKQIQKNIPIY